MMFTRINIIKFKYNTKFNNIKYKLEVQILIYL